MKSPLDAIAWWEIRRIPFNLAVFAAGTVSVFAIIGVGGTLVKPGDDFVEPLMLLAGIIGFGILANLFYTLGWISELLWSGGDTELTAPFRPKVFRAGLIGSMVLALAPCGLMAVIWTVFHIR